MKEGEDWKQLDIGQNKVGAKFAMSDIDITEMLDRTGIAVPENWYQLDMDGKTWSPNEENIIIIDKFQACEGMSAQEVFEAHGKREYPEGGCEEIRIVPSTAMAERYMTAYQKKNQAEGYYLLRIGEKAKISGTLTVPEGVNALKVEGPNRYDESTNTAHFIPVNISSVNVPAGKKLSLRKKSGGFFGSGESTGSVGVVTINMPRIAYQSKTPEEFYRRLDHMMDLAARSLHIKREVITKLLNEGLYPYTKRYLGSFSNHFSTIGLVGMNEAGLNACWLGGDMSDERTQQFTKEVLLHMRERLSDYQVEYEGELFNLEATPAESTAYRLAKHDRKRWPDIRTAGSRGDTPYYTNSSHLPVEYTTDIFDALDIQDELQTLYTSGTVFHAFIGEKLPDWKAAAALVRKIAENYKLPYYTISPTYSVCKEHGYISGEHFTCPKCGKKAEVYSRITGYYRPVQNWNDGKAQEYKNRTLYDVMHSQLKKMKPVHTSVVTMTEDDVKIQPVTEHKYLFTTSTCPNCKMAKKMLEGEELEIIDAEKNPEMAREFGIMQAPTLVVMSGKNVTKYVNASNIQKYVDDLEE